MLSNQQIKKLVDYWKSGAEDNYKTMLSLYRSRHYSACLFFGHLVLEKTLKILVIKKTKNYPPHTHNLSHLVELAQVELQNKEMDFLATANAFNIEGRYPEEKYDFYKVCDKKFTDPYFKQIKQLFKKLWEEQV